MAGLPGALSSRRRYSPNPKGRDTTRDTKLAFGQSQDQLERVNTALEFNELYDVVPKYSRQELLTVRSWVFSTATYLAFIALFSIVVFANRPGQQAFFYTNALREAILFEPLQVPGSVELKTFNDIDNLEDTELWLRSTLIPGLYGSTYYNGDPMGEKRKRFIFGVGYVVGSVRLRQLRVKENSCKVFGKMKDLVNTCLAEFSESAMETADYTPLNGNNATEQGYTYHEGRQGILFEHSGQLRFYPNGGYVVDLPPDLHEAQAVVDELHSNRWLDDRTRALFVELTVFNPNIDLFCIIRILVELSASGTAIGSSNFRTMDLGLYDTTGDQFMLALEILLVVAVVFFLFEEGREMVAARNNKEKGCWSYWLDDGWNYLDLTNLSFFLIVIGLRAATVVQTRELFASSELADGNRYVNFQDVGTLRQIEQYVQAFNMLFCWIKTFKYLQSLPRIGLLVKVLVHSFKDIMLFFVMLFFVYFGYAQSAYMMFGNDIFFFRSLTASFQSLMRAILGDFDYLSIYESNRTLGPIFFISYMLIVFFVMINMFIAIITSSYELVREEETARQLERERTAQMRAILYNSKPIRSPWEQFKDLLEMVWLAIKLRPEQRSLIEIIEAGDLDLDGDGLITEYELSKMLPKDTDVGAIIRQYDHNGDGKLDPKELKQWMEDLQREKTMLEEQLSTLLELDEDAINDPNAGVNADEIFALVDAYLAKVKTHLPAKGDSTLLHFEYKPLTEERRASRASVPTLATTGRQRSSSTNLNALARRRSVVPGGPLEQAAKKSPRKLQTIDSEEPVAFDAAHLHDAGQPHAAGKKSGRPPLNPHPANGTGEGRGEGGARTSAPLMTTYKSTVSTGYRGPHSSASSDLEEVELDAMSSGAKTPAHLPHQRSISGRRAASKESLPGPRRRRRHATKHSSEDETSSYTSDDDGQRPPTSSRKIMVAVLRRLEAIEKKLDEK